MFATILKCTRDGDWDRLEMAPAARRQANRPGRGIIGSPTPGRRRPAIGWAGRCMVVSKSLTLQTKGRGDTHDLTGAVARAIGESGVRSGVVTLFVIGSTAGLTTIE